MPVVKNMRSFEPGHHVAQALPPIIGLASRPVFRVTRSFEYWNLEFLWSLKFGAWSFFSQPAPPKFKV